jgi:hypothetical protein
MKVNEPPARVPAVCRLFLAWELPTYRTVKLPGGY